MNIMSSDERPSLVAQIARIAQTTAVVASPVLSRPHLASLRRRIRVAKNDKRSNSRDLFSDRHSEDRISRGMLWILSINVHFVVQRPSGNDLKAAIFNLDREKTSSHPLGRYAGSSFANTAGIGINSPKDTVHVINVVLGHARRTDGDTETRICIFYASTVVADFT